MSTKKTTQSVEKIYKSISHIERLENPSFRPDPAVQPSEHYTFGIEQVVDKFTNRVVKKIVKKLDNPDPHKHLKVSDFSLENLQASGAIDNIKPCTLAHDNHTIVSTLETSAHNIIDSNKTE